MNETFGLAVSNTVQYYVISIPYIFAFYSKIVSLNKKYKDIRI